MPPKAKKNEPSKKTTEKKKEKVIEDKTFGLKNKKGAKQQKFISHVTQQVKFGNQKSSKLEELKKLDGSKKKKETDELNDLFKPVTQTVSKGADPKSVLCAFFKQGQCTKGAKCKFSHDLNVERKGEKRNIYEDNSAEDTMENWDEAQLEEVINKKHGEAEKAKPKTAIICKFFLDAVENSKYGWFWECPNGGKNCHYRHALPPGFVLKRDQKKEDKEKEISIEELIEKERAMLGVNVTRVTLETFLAWKERKRKEKIDAAKAAKDKKKAEFTAGRVFGISGREMFEFNPDLVGEDDNDAGEDVLIIRRDNDEDEEGFEVREISLEALATAAQKEDGTGTVSTSHDRVGLPSSVCNGDGDSKKDDEAGKLEEAAALPPEKVISETDAVIAAAMAATVNGNAGEAIEIDEDLFGGDDIDLIEDDLDTLDLDN